MLHLQGAEGLKRQNNSNLVRASEGSDHSWEHGDLHVLWPGLLLLVEANGCEEAPLSPSQPPTVDVTYQHGFGGHAFKC